MTQFALPDRPLKITKAGRPTYWGRIIGSLIMIAIGCVVAFFQMPSLQHDWVISRNPVLVYDGDVRNGKCTTRKAIFTDCSAHLSYSVDGQQYETETSLMFVDFHSGDYMVDVVRSSDKPELATMSIGIEKLWNRIILFLVLIALTAGIGVWLFATALGMKRAAEMMARPGRIEVVPVKLISVQNARRQDSYTYQSLSGVGGTSKKVATFGKKEQPLMQAGADGSATALAVRHQAAKSLVLLDSRLTRLDLTAAERDAALAGLQGV
ncbi:MAG: hypothetical protein WAT09_13755 [Paracoccaceae bacterium]